MTHGTWKTTGGTGGTLAAGAVTALILAAGTGAAAAVHAAEIAVLAGAVTAGAAAGAGVTALVLRARSRSTGTSAALPARPPWRQPGDWPPSAVRARQRGALPAPQVHIHVSDPAALAGLAGLAGPREQVPGAPLRRAQQAPGRRP